MLAANFLAAAIAQGRIVERAVPGDPALGPLTQLPGTWTNLPDFPGHGWNMIALPYKEPGKTVNPNTPDQNSVFRLLLNQFNETLIFSTVDKGVQNRGAAQVNVFDRDQHLAALQYIQNVAQIAAADFPVTPNRPDTPKGAATIHHEPGLFLHLFSGTDGGPDIARLATIPHGDAALALGTGTTKAGPPTFTEIGDFQALPVGVGIGLDVNTDPYLLPYKTFTGANKFQGLFDPTNPLDLLKGAIAGKNIKTTTSIVLDTTLATGGIHNIPFVVKQANATSMRAIFWIEELADPGPDGKPQFMLQYAQRVYLDFFSTSLPPEDALNCKIRWPHISINTMTLTARP